MLIITRRPNESLLIGDARVICLGCPGGRRVRLGIEAPPDTRIVREELLADSQEGADHDDR